MTILRKCTSRLVETDIDGERVAMSLESGEFFALKDTALVIWSLLDKPIDRAGLLAELANSYDAGQDVLAADLDGFLAQLLAAGLLERD
jgi:Coenzyme PQQ synthesis protein D (PqqD)